MENLGKTPKKRVRSHHTPKEKVGILGKFSSPEEEDQAINTALSTMAKGDLVTGKIQEILNGEVFIALENGILGKVPSGEVSYYLKDKAEYLYHVGEKIQVRVCYLNLQRQKLTLSIKKVQEHPWLSQATSLPLHQTVHCTLCNCSPKGIIVKITPKVFGFIRAGELKNAGCWHENLPTGLKVDVEILNIIPESKTVKLKFIKIVG